MHLQQVLSKGNSNEATKELTDINYNEEKSPNNHVLYQETFFPDGEGTSEEEREHFAIKSVSKYHKLREIEVNP